MKLETHSVYECSICDSEKDRLNELVGSVVNVKGRQDIDVARENGDIYIFRCITVVVARLFRMKKLSNGTTV